jgi:hypothetical protein
MPVETTVHPTPAGTHAYGEHAENGVNWDLLQRLYEHLRDNVKPETVRMSSYYRLSQDISELVPDFHQLMVENSCQSNSKLTVKHCLFPCGSTACVLGHGALSRDLNPELYGPPQFSDQVMNERFGDLWTYMFGSEWDYCVDEDKRHAEALGRMGMILARKGWDRADLDAFAKLRTQEAEQGYQRQRDE